MPREHLIACGGAVPTPADVLPGSRLATHQLRFNGPGANARLSLGQVGRATWARIPPLLQDLAELAAYVYVADRACARGPDRADAGWRRRLHFRVAVRCPERWRDPDVHDALVGTLSFLSEDEYHFEFQSLTAPPPFEEYLQFGKESRETFDEVQLFSGGADSLAGAAEQILAQRKRTLLLHHQSNPKAMPLVRDLVERLRGLAQRRGPRLVSVEVCRTDARDADPYQRARSFLFAIIGAVVACQVGLRRLAFYENGVVSLNLPLAGAVVGARASRTTHPRFLKQCSAFLSALLQEPFAVVNPYQPLTKTQVLRRLADAGAVELLADSRSCVSPRLGSNDQPHCGVCSQCLDRRFAVLAAGLTDHDPAGGYRVDLLLGGRPGGADQTMLAAYVASVQSLAELDEAAFCARYGELTRALPHLDQTADLAAHQAFALYRRHADDVNRVLQEEIRRLASAIYLGRLPGGSLLDMILPQGSQAEPAAPADPTGRPNAPYLFVRRGTHWRIRFAAGEELILPADRGMDYLHMLLCRQGHPVSAAQLCREAIRSAGRAPAGVAMASVRDTGGSVLEQDVPDTAAALADPTALAAYHTALVELREELEQAQQENDQATILRVSQEIDVLTQELRQSGAAAQASDRVRADRKKVVGAVGNAIRRAVRKIHRYDRALAEHLSAPILQCGCHSCYNPPERIDWLT